MTVTSADLPRHATVDERVVAGREARKRIPRAELAALLPPAADRDPVAILQAQATARQPDLLPIRYGRMATSPFAYLRGAAAVMAADLGAMPVTGFRVQAIGDAHVSNFGVFASPERRLVFDVNDFDETLPAPWEWDVKRLVASVVVAAEANGRSRRAALSAASGAAATYRRALRSFASTPFIDVWYAHLDVGDWVGTKERKGSRAKAERELATIRRRTGAHVVGRLTERVDGELRFVAAPPLLTPLRALVDPADADAVADLVKTGFAEHRKSLAPDRRRLLDRYRLVDLARKVVGVGSVGTRSLIALLVGRDDGDALVLQFKEASASVLAPYAGASQYRQHGARVVNGQRLVQAASDVFLGWNTIAGLDGMDEHYYWRQLKDMKGSIEIGLLDDQSWGRFLDACAWSLARAHARSGDATAIASYLGRGTAFDKAMAEFAVAYADRTTADWEALKAAIVDGRVEARAGV